MRRRGPRTRRDIYEEARQMALVGERPPDIHRTLQELFPDEEPTLRTVQQWVKEWARDESGAWDLTLGDADDAAAALVVLASLIEATEGGVRDLTNEEASTVGRLARVYPDMPPLTMYDWARSFARARREGESTTAMTQYLAFSPWRDRGERYVRAADSGWIDVMLAFGPQDREWLPASRQTRGSLPVGAWLRRASSTSDHTE